MRGDWRRAVLALLLMLLPLPAAAQPYPAKNITIVVAFAAGGVADGIARLVGQRLAEKLGQGVVVENRGGAGGNVAAKHLTGAAPDGYTLLATTTALAINETLHKNKGYSAADFKTVAIVASTPEVLAVNATNTKNLSDLLKGAPGNPINYGSAGVGTGSHVAAEYFFKVLAKAPAAHVPFQGGAPAINAAVGGHVEMIAASLAGGLAAQIGSGALRGLAVASDKRAAVIPAVPTFAEAGFPNFEAASWVGFFAPPKTSADILHKLNGAIDAIVKEPEVQQRLKTLGFDALIGSQAEAERRFTAEVDKWGKMVGSAGLATN
jgi:tripartite-type tricarboxylate transporter receptor subunit TctC